MRKKLSFFLERGPAYLLWLVSFIIPRSRRKWCFGSQIALSGSNSKYLMLDIMEKFPDIKCAWITDDDNTFQILTESSIPVYKKWSLRGIIYSLTSKVYVYTHGPGDINFSTSGGTFKINLWHGVGIKKSEYLAHLSWVNKKSIIHRLVYPFYCVNHDIILLTSKTLLDLYSKTFRQSSDSFIYSFVPRSRTAYYTDEKRNRFLNTIDRELKPYISKIEKYNRTFFYMPTYRNDGSDKSVIELSGLNLLKLNDVLSKRNDLFLIKLHPNDIEKIKDVKNLSNIIFIREKIDPYLLFPYIHTLITDYSSIYSEFLLFHNSIIIFDFDYDLFQNTDSGLWFDFLEFTSGVHADSSDKLISLVELEDCYPIPDVDGMMEKYWGECGEYKLPEKIYEITQKI